MPLHLAPLLGVLRVSFLHGLLPPSSPLQEPIQLHPPTHLQKHEGEALWGWLSGRWTQGLPPMWQGVVGPGWRDVCRVAGPSGIPGAEPRGSPGQHGQRPGIVGSKAPNTSGRPKVRKGFSGLAPSWAGEPHHGPLTGADLEQWSSRSPPPLFPPEEETDGPQQSPNPFRPAAPEGRRQLHTPDPRATLCGWKA